MTEDEARRTGLPLSTGAAAGDNPLRRPPPVELPDNEEGPPEVTAPPPLEPPPPPLPQAEEPMATEDADDDLATLHARFDRVEDTLKRKLGVASLHRRFDSLEAWLAQHFN